MTRLVFFLRLLGLALDLVAAYVAAPAPAVTAAAVEDCQAPKPQAEAAAGIGPCTSVVGPAVDELICHSPSHFHQVRL